LYGAKFGFLTLKEGHRLKVFENIVLRIYELKRNEIMSLEKFHEDKIGRACSTHGDKRNTCKFSMGKSE
jgi:hypothetical protein